MAEDNNEARSSFYPLRSSELVHSSLFGETILPKPEEILNLSLEEREAILVWEAKELFPDLKRLKDLDPEEHTVYPDYFTTEEGWRLFQLVYRDGNLKTRTEEEAKKKGIDLEDERKRKEYYDGVFEEIKLAAKSKESIKKYQEKYGVNFQPTTRPYNKEQAEQRFFDLPDLSIVPTQVRKRLSNESSDWARDQFLADFRQAGGRVEMLADPYRITKVAEVEKLKQKFEGYRDLKKRLKTLVEQEKKEGRINEAKVILLGIYQRYLNVLLAEGYKYGRILTLQPVLSADEKVALEAIKGSNRDMAEDRFSRERASRTMERMDHFLQGIGLQVLPEGKIVFQTITERLKEEAEKRAARTKITQEIEIAGKIQKINGIQTGRIGNLVLGAYGLDKAGWSIYLSPTAKVFSVVFKERGKFVRQVIIPINKERKLTDALSVLSHEEEGHALAHYNSERVGLKLIEEFSTGRSGVLSEGVAMLTQARTESEMGLPEEKANHYYLAALVEKQKGGTFKDCFLAFLKTRAWVKQEDLAEYWTDDKKWQDAWSYVYSRTLRIFRKETPLDDSSGKITTSDELDYLEQEEVVKALQKSDLEWVLSVSGVDLYALPDLIRLGLLDPKKVVLPKMVVAKKIWPKIKKTLDEGKTIDEAIGALEQS